MSLRTSLSRQPDRRILDPDRLAELACQAAKRLEDVGDYEGARAALAEFWPAGSERPELGRLGGEAAAEVLLRAGTLTGWLGARAQVCDAQETAKNLITEAGRAFESAGRAEKVLEAQVELAYCYWRQGAYDEARVILEDVLAGLPSDCELKAKAVLRRAIVERSAARYSDALRVLNERAPLFEKITNSTIKGGYHNELGVVCKNLAACEGREEYIDRAFVEYAAASVHFEQAGHRPYNALVENNLGFLFFEAGRFDEAHEHLARARRIFHGLKDRGSVAQVDDTRARVLLAEGRDAEAERVARGAVRALESGGRQSLLAETLTTHGMALARLGLHEQARASLWRAMDVAHESGALSDAGAAALAVIEELGAGLSAGEAESVYRRADAWLEGSQHLPTLARLRRAAGLVIAAGRATASGGDAVAGRSAGPFRELMRQYENGLVRQALQRGGGSVTQAARLLGLTHQALIYILERRHRDLLAERTPKLARARADADKRSDAPRAEELHT